MCVLFPGCCRAPGGSDAALALGVVQLVVGERGRACAGAKYMPAQVVLVNEEQLRHCSLRLILCRV